MNQKKNEKPELVLDIIRTKSAVRIGTSETTSIAVQKLGNQLEVTRKGRDFLIYDKRTGKLTEVLAENIAYIQHDSITKQQPVEAGDSSTSGSETA